MQDMEKGFKFCSCSFLFTEPVPQKFFFGIFYQSMGWVVIDINKCPDLKMWNPELNNLAD
jgi:hypothetical protein